MTERRSVRSNFQMSSLVEPLKLPDLPSEIIKAIEPNQLNLSMQGLLRKESEIHARTFLYRSTLARAGDFEKLPPEVQEEIWRAYLSCLVAIAYISYRSASLLTLKSVLANIGELDKILFSDEVKDLVEKLVYNVIVRDTGDDTVDYLESIFPQFFQQPALGSLKTFRRAYSEFRDGNEPKSVVILKGLVGLDRVEAIGAVMLLSHIYHEHRAPFEEMSCLTNLQAMVPKLTRFSNIADMVAGTGSAFSAQLREQFQRLVKLHKAAGDDETVNELIEMAQSALVDHGLEDAEISLARRRNGIEIVHRDRDELVKENAVHDVIQDLILHSRYKLACIVNRSERLGENLTFRFDHEDISEEVLLFGIIDALQELDVVIPPALVSESTFDQRKWFVISSGAGVGDALAVSLYFFEGDLSVAFYSGLFFDTVLEGKKDQSWFGLAAQFLDRKFDEQTFNFVYNNVRAFLSSRSPGERMPDVREF